MKFLDLYLLLTGTKFCVGNSKSFTYYCMHLI